MNTAKLIDIFNTLIEVNNDRREGYETAAKETNEADLKTLFADCQETSQQCIAELTHEVHQLGGMPTQGTSTSGKFFRAWMDIKVALTANDRKTILDSCEYGEDAAIAIYEGTLTNNRENLETRQRLLINDQCAFIKADHGKIKDLRDMLVLEQDYDVL
jgi:uncharacterized protein (TIGR02284 family)